MKRAMVEHGGGFAGAMRASGGVGGQVGAPYNNE